MGGVYDMFTARGGSKIRRVESARAVVTSGSKGMGNRLDIERVEALAVGEYADIMSARSFEHGTATGAPVATYHVRRVL